MKISNPDAITNIMTRMGNDATLLEAAEYMQELLVESGYGDLDMTKDGIGSICCHLIYSHGPSRGLTGNTEDCPAVLLTRHLVNPADAQHIVRCVNAHDALVEALEGMHGMLRHALENGLWNSDSEESRFEEAVARLDAARAALVLAKKA